MPVYGGSRYRLARMLRVINLREGLTRRLLIRYNMLTDELFEAGDVEFLDYTSKEGDRFDTLAAEFGGDASKWWVIAEINGFVGFPLDLEPGTPLRIPPQSYFEEV